MATTPSEPTPNGPEAVSAPEGWGGCNPFIVRVNEYRRDAGAATISPTGHGLRINPANITYIYTAGRSTDDHNIFYVYFTNTQRIITDWSGVDDLTWYKVPTSGH